MKTEQNNYVTISLSNSKLGGFIPNVSLPLSTCRKDVPCRKGCYANKGHYKYDNIQKCYENNLRIFKEDQNNYFNQIINFLNNEEVTYRYFRWHSSGEIVNYRYLLGMIETAKRCPLTTFLCFTKKYSIVNMYLAMGHDIPSNLVIVFSGWDKNWKVDNPYNLPTTYVHFNGQDNSEIPFDAIECSGHCDKCKTCWHLLKGESVYFHKH